MDTKLKDLAVWAHSRAECELVGVARALVSERHSPHVAGLLEALARAVAAEQAAYAAMQVEREKLIAAMDARIARVA